jgi:hypothetical protein
VEWGNLLSGLAGAVVGFGGALAIRWLDGRRAEAAAARAVFMEVAANNSALVFSAKHGVYIPLTTTVWLTEQVRLAHAFSARDYVVVATFYMRVDLLRSRGLPIGGPPRTDVKTVAEEAVPRGEAAADILERRGWWP